MSLQNKKRESPADFIPGMKRFLQHTTRLFRSLVMCLTRSYGCAILLTRKNVLYGGSMRPKPTPSFILSLPLQVNAQQAAQLHAHFECARQLSNALLAEAMKRLRRMKADPAQAGLLAAFPVPTSSHARRLSLVCARAMASLNTACTRRPSTYAPVGWLPTSTASWRRSWPAGPTRRPIGSAWARPGACAFAAKDEAWTRWRARPTPRGCASSCKPERKVTRAGSAGTASRSRP